MARAVQSVEFQALATDGWILAELRDAVRKGDTYRIARLLELLDGHLQEVIALL